MGKLIGYARVSTRDQTERLQLDAMEKAGCRPIFRDHGVSGSKTSRHGLDQALATLQRGDTLVVWRLDRLGRSLKHLIETVDALQARGVNFVSLTEQIDTTTSGGRLIFHVFGALAEFERNLIKERTRAGLEAARARGHVGGRPCALSEAQAKRAWQLHQDGETVTAVAERYNVSRPALYGAWKRYGLVEDTEEAS